MTHETHKHTTRAKKKNTESKNEAEIDGRESKTWLAFTKSPRYLDLSPSSTWLRVFICSRLKHTSRIYADVYGEVRAESPRMGRKNNPPPPDQNTRENHKTQKWNFQMLFFLFSGIRCRKSTLFRSIFLNTSPTTFWIRRGFFPSGNAESRNLSERKRTWNDFIVHVRKQV